MYTTIIIEDIKKNLKDYSHYKLAYVDSIEQTYCDYDQATKDYMKTDQYERDKAIYGWNNPKVRMVDFPSPNYIPGWQEYYAYFCDAAEMGEIWGDDFDDSPYSCNSGCPYDNVYLDDGSHPEIEVLKVPFSVPHDDWNNFDIKFPNSWPMINEPWCTEDINLGCIPWIWARTCRRKGRNQGVCVMAGINPYDFIQKIVEIWKMYEEGLLVENPDRYKIRGVYEIPGGEKYYMLEDEPGYKFNFYRDSDLRPLNLETLQRPYGERICSDTIINPITANKYYFEPEKWGMKKLRRMPGINEQKEIIQKTKRTWMDR